MAELTARARKRVDAVGYDEFDGFVCVAPSEEAARSMYPDEPDGPGDPCAMMRPDESWPPRRKIVVTLIAEGAPGPARVVLSSFNAG